MRTISENGLLFTSLWEKFIPVAYKATHSEKYYTIGWGHYGADVKQGQQITKQAAIELLKSDIAKAVKKQMSWLVNHSINRNSMPFVTYASMLVPE